MQWRKGIYIQSCHLAKFLHKPKAFGFYFFPTCPVSEKLRMYSKCFYMHFWAMNSMESMCRPSKRLVNTPSPLLSVLGTLYPLVWFLIINKPEDPFNSRGVSLKGIYVLYIKCQCFWQKGFIQRQQSGLSVRWQGSIEPLLSKTETCHQRHLGYIIRD